MLHSVLINQLQDSNRTYTLAFVVAIRLYMIVRHRDRSWYMSELADGEANLVFWDVHGNQRHAGGV
jgi:hypothetical protein